MFSLSSRFWTFLQNFPRSHVLETKYLTQLSLAREIGTPEETGLVLPLENCINSLTNVTFSARNTVCSSHSSFFNSLTPKILVNNN
jgi:hypothetical protein